jgi:Leucine-rich repeat (LRR) protein
VFDGKTHGKKKKKMDPSTLNPQPSSANEPSTICHTHAASPLSKHELALLSKSTTSVPHLYHLLRWVLDVVALEWQQQSRMWLPPELAMLVCGYLDPHDQRVCTTQLCSSGAGFVANQLANDGTTILLHELVACCRLSACVDDVAHEGIERVRSFVKRRGNVHTIILDAQLNDEQATNASVYSDFHRLLQQGSSFQLSQNQGITVEWHVRSETIALVEFLLKVDMPKDDAREDDSSAGGAIRQYLHTLILYDTRVCDVSGLATCQSLHTLDLSYTHVSDVSALVSCQLLHTLDLQKTQVSDVSALALCQSLHTLNLFKTNVSDVSALASCQNLHTLDISYIQVSDIAPLTSCQSLHTLDLSHTRVINICPLASCQSLHTLDLSHTRVINISPLASCKSLHTLDLGQTQVSDVSGLASCQSLHTLNLAKTQVSDVSALASCQALHTLSLEQTAVIYVSALEFCQSLHTLNLQGTRVSDLYALAWCESLDTVILNNGFEVTDVSLLFY